MLKTDMYGSRETANQKGASTPNRDHIWYLRLISTSNRLPMLGPYQTISIQRHPEIFRTELIKTQIALRYADTIMYLGNIQE